MRVTLFSCFFILFLNCEDRESKNKIDHNTTGNTYTPVSTSEEISIDKKEAEFPVLDDNNAMPFFAEYSKQHKENKVRMSTDFGDIEILLYNDTRYLRANFIYLTNRQYFDGTQFYRVIDNYIIQGGSGDDKETTKRRNKIGRYLLPTDTNKGYKHNRGVLSMPSSDIDNPHKLASPYEFFIVQQHGGSHTLNGDYTVFGEVTKGMEVVDKIAAVDTDDSDWPLQNVYIRKVEIIN